MNDDNARRRPSGPPLSASQKETLARTAFWNALTRVAEKAERLLDVAIREEES